MWLAQRAYRRRRGSAAWLVATLERQERIPDLDDMLGERKPAPVQSPDEMITALLAWQVALAPKGE